MMIAEKGESGRLLPHPAFLSAVLHANTGPDVVSCESR